MKRLGFIVLTICILAAPLFAALDPNNVWETRTTGAQTNGGAVRWQHLVTTSYKWTLSGSGTGEYHLEAIGGGDPSLTEPVSVTTDGNYNLAGSGTLGSLTAGQWAWGDNDTLGYNTLYVRLAGDLDPDYWLTHGRRGYVSCVYGGGRDYSQQDAAQLTLTDVATDGAGTGLSSVTGGWTADMVWNVCYITGGTSTPGWYQIVAVADPNNITIDRTCGAGKTGVTCKVGGAFSWNGTLAEDMSNMILQDNIVWFASGTHTVGENLGTLNNGTTGAFIRYLGYKTTRGDSPRRTDRPTVDVGIYSFLPGNNSLVAHLRFTSSGGSTAGGTSTNVTFFNCAAVNTSAGSDKHAFSGGSGSMLIIGCQGQTAGTGTTSAAFYGSGGRFMYCFGHNSLIGFNLWSLSSEALQCIADTCTTGIDMHGSNTFGFSNTVYNCTTGVNLAGNGDLLINTIVDACTTGVLGATAYPDNWLLHNCIDATTPITTAVALGGNVFGDPGLRDPANDDFSVDAADTNVYEKGLDVGYYTDAQTY